MQLTPARYVPAANREAILRAALQVFSDTGYEGATTRKIAALAGIEPGHLAYYYRSKMQLWQAVVEEFANEGKDLLANGRIRLQGLPAAKIVSELLPPLLRSFASNPQLTRLMLQEFSVSGERHDWVVQTFGIPAWDVLHPLFSELEQEGLLSGATAAAAYMHFFGGALLAFGTHDYFASLSGCDHTQEPALSRYIDLLMKPLLQKG
jgi:TetR/AcrR family transcriptional regulator